MNGNIFQLPKFSEDARKRWNQIPEDFRAEVLNCVYCAYCCAGSPLQLREGKMVGASLVLQGTCKICGGDAARVIEPAE